MDYDGLEAGDPRERASEGFLSRWGTQAERVIFAPGRINLIGDHTDYSLLPVLPMAIQRGIAFAIAPHSEGVVVDSLDEPGEFTLGADQTSTASWHRYAEAALEPAQRRTEGVRIMLAGDLPSTGGLSSSSALVLGLLAATRPGTHGGIGGRALVDEAVAAERRAAIEGGAMDQTVIVFGEPGSALRIDFDPESSRPVPIPEELALVAAFSGETAAKGEAARDHYNARVVACRVGAALLSRSLGRTLPDPLVLSPLADAPVETVESLPERITPVDAAEACQLDVDRLVAMTTDRFDETQDMPIRSAVRHALDEARAVEQAEAALLANELERFGLLLNESHQSLRRFGSSTAALDRLVDSMRDAGALGARVTGAGFGGYAIAACRPDRLEAVLSAARKATGGPAFRVHASAGIR